MRDVANVPLYSEMNVPIAETEDDVASKSVPDENPMGIGRVPKLIESATSKRRDSIEAEFDIITEEEVEEAKMRGSRRFEGCVPPRLYHGGYPSTGNVNYSQVQPNYPRLLQPQFNQPAAIYHPPPPINAYPPQQPPSMLNWAFGKPIAKHAIRSQRLLAGTVLSRF